MPDSALSRATIALMNQLTSANSSPTEFEARVLERSMVDLMDALIVQYAIVPGRETEVDAELRAAVQRLVSERFSDPEFGPSAVAQALGLGMRRLYRLYEAQPESVAGVIRNARLTNVAESLSSQATAPLTEIATNAGFAGVDQAARAFKSRFGGDNVDVPFRQSGVQRADRALIICHSE